MLSLDIEKVKRKSVSKFPSSVSISLKAHSSLHQNQRQSSKRASLSTQTTVDSMCGNSGEFSASDEMGTTSTAAVSSLPASSDDTTITIEEEPTTSTSSQVTTTTHNCEDCEKDAVYYFGYGTIVHPMVRYRRGCMIPSENVKTAILYDHRLRFAEGGTANIVPARGWDVKGVLLKFQNRNDFEVFRSYDANYELQEVSVSVIDKNNGDPEKKNACTSPFGEDLDAEGNDQQIEEDDGDNDSVGNPRMHNSLPLYKDDDDHSCSDDEEYSCPFSLDPTPKSKKEDPNAIKCFTFSLPKSSRIGNNRSETSSFCKPQERYLKLMTDGLRSHEVDETYIRDEILAVDYIPTELDRVVDTECGYRKFPVSKKLSNITLGKYESKLCKADSADTYFVCGNKVLKIDGGLETSQNPCTKWLRLHGHGKTDITFVVHQTFVDPDCLHTPFVDSPEDLTPKHVEWAEHAMVLYLERGGLTASVVHELDTRGKRDSHFLSGMGKSMPVLKVGRFKNRASDARMNLTPPRKRFSDVSSRAYSDIGSTTSPLRANSTINPGHKPKRSLVFRRNKGSSS